MRLARLLLFASIGPLLLVTGCYRSYAPYGAPSGVPYGVPGAPVQTLTPGNPYTPYPQGMPGPSPTPVDQYSVPNSTFQPSGPGGSSQYYPSNSSTLPSYQGGVPTPRDPGEVQFQPRSTPKPVADDFDLMEQGAVEGAGAATATVAKVPLDTAEFHIPQRVKSITSPSGCPDDISTTGSSASPFAHDADGYRWLRGLARRNESTGAWSILYSHVDVDGDPYHGWLTLAPDPQLTQLVPDGAFLITGHLDKSKTDSSGKPMYRVESIKPWHPAGRF